MAKLTGGVAQKVWEIAEPLADEIGIWIWDVEFVKEGARRVLRITVDSEEGIGIEDCEKLHRAVDPLLDEADLIEEQYYLEVSSPGLERELRTDAHIDASLGETVSLRFFAPFEGQKSMEGTLVGREGDSILVEIGGERREIPRSAIAKIQTVFEF